MIIRILNLTFLFILFALTARSQSNHEINGVVQDVANTPLRYATIVLSLKGSDQPFMVSTTDTAGRYRIQNIPANNYTLQAQLLGYKTLKFDHIIIAAEAVYKRDFQLEEVIKTLKEVKIQGARKVIESIPGGYIYNVGVKKNTSQNIKDLLSRVPGVYVDASGIRIQGNASVTVLMDGKNVQLTGSELIDYLKSLPASNIGSIAVITAPSARYDAQGTGGILEIKSSAPKDKGFLNRISLSGSTHDKYSTLLSSNYNQSSFSAFLNFRYAHTNAFSKFNTSSTNLAQNGAISSVIDQQSRTDDTPGNGFLVNTGGSWNFSAADNLSVNLQLNYYKGSALERINTRYLLNNESDIQSINSINPSNSHSDNQRVSAGYIHKFKKSGSQISADFNGFFQSRNSRTNALSAITTTDSAYQNLINTRANNQTNIYTTNIDFTLMLDKSSALVAGLKSNMVEKATKFNYLETLQDNATENFNNLDYNEKINAAYAIYKRNFKTTTITAGIRAEHTDVDIRFAPSNSSNSQSYFNLFPNLGLSQKLNNGQSLDFSYSRRIDRPKFSSFSSAVDLANPLTIRVNNPYLRPVFLHAFDLTYSKQTGIENFVSINISQKFINNAFDHYTLYDPNRGKYIDTIVNYKGGSISALNITTSHAITKGTTITNSATLRYVNIKNGDLPDVNSLKRSAFTYFYSFSLSSDITKTLYATLTGNYSSPQISIQSRNKGVGSVDVSITKLLFNENLNVSCELTDAFNTNRSASDVYNPLFFATTYSKEETRIFSINLAYRFGKNFRTKARRYKAATDNRIDDK